MFRPQKFRKNGEESLKSSKIMIFETGGISMKVHSAIKARVRKIGCLQSIRPYVDKNTSSDLILTLS